MAASHRNLIERQRQIRLAQEADDRIASVQRLLGYDDDAKCRVCDGIITIFGHTENCALWKIDPALLEREIAMGHQTLHDNSNKQRLFYSDKKQWSGVPGKKQKTLVRKKHSKNRGPKREFQHCSVCHKRTIFINNRCNLCKHNRPCAYAPLGINCQVCHPKESL